MYDFDSVYSTASMRAHEILKEFDSSVVWGLNSTGGRRRTWLILGGQSLATLLAYPPRPEATWTVEGYGEFVFRFDEDQVAMLARFEQWFAEALRAVC